jgi:2-polyprenyl-6-methoxyphenol hydroxylase-like FAD-dependent oxidoreductase
MRAHAFDVAVLGAGPVGLVAALEFSQRCSTVLVVDRAPTQGPMARLEAVPVTLVRLLLQFGIDPVAIGVDRLFDQRHIAWERNDPQTLPSPQIAHVEHRALSRSLFSIAQNCRRLSLIVESTRPLLQQGLYRGRAWRARRVIDATGRRAITAVRRIHPPKPWVARICSARRSASSTDGSLRIAALPFGYVYRLGSTKYDTIGVVGRGRSLGGAPDMLERALQDAGAAWILEGLPHMESMRAHAAHPASVQWTDNSRVTAIGDAALSRDILASQGLATGISDALYAAAAVEPEALRLFGAHQREQRNAHLTALLEQIAKCRFRDEPVWRDYHAFIARHVGTRTSFRTVALVDGRIVDLSRRPGPWRTPDAREARASIAR